MFKKTYWWKGSLIFSVVAVAIAGAVISGEAAQISTRTPTPTRTPYRRRTPTPTRTPVLAKLKRQLSWGGLGAGSSEEYCEKLMPRNRRDLPAIVGTNRLKVHELAPDNLQNMGGLCIFGLPFKDGLILELYDPSGKLVERMSYRLGSYNDALDFWLLEPVRARAGTMKQEASFVKDVEVIFIEMWWPQGLTVGRWWAVVKTPYGSVQGQFNVPALPDKPLVNFGKRPLWIFPKASPLDESSEVYLTSSSCVSRKSGDVLTLYGANFKPGSLTPIGIYLSDPEDEVVNLFAQGSVKADRKGEWQVSYTIKSSDLPGSYHFSTVVRPEEDHIYFAGPSVCYVIDRWQPCSNSYPSRLRAGIRAKVNEKPPLANRVRSQPAVSARIVGRLEPGEEFIILDGPRCSNSWVWWYVEAKDGLRGWTAEGDKNTYWLSPLYVDY